MIERRRAAAIVFVCALMALVVSIHAGKGGAAPVPGELIAQPALGAPAETFLGASPVEAEGEVWATAAKGRRIARYTNAGGWETLPAPVGADGQPAPGLTFLEGATVGRTTAAGGVVAAATVEEPPVEEPSAEEPPVEGAQTQETQALVVRSPGGPLRTAPAPEEGLLEPEEELFGTPPRLAAVEEPGGVTGAFVIPTKEKEPAPKFVLHFNGVSWTKDPICFGVAPECVPPTSSAFRVLAIEAGANGEAWMLGRSGLKNKVEPIDLFAREPGGGPEGTTVWRHRSLGATPPGSLFEKGAAGVTMAVHGGQPLTITAEGVWVDATLRAGESSVDATFYYDIATAQVTASWCDLTAPEGLCTKPFGNELPGGEYRSFAWPGGGPFGQRVITGVGNGAILNLEGESFVRVPLAGDQSGATLGAALSSPESGWLGAAEAPLHLVRVGSTAEPSQLQPWPVPFRRPLLAVAGEQGVPVGGLESAALAVGAEGQVARYLPGIGWQPESLLDAGGLATHPTLRGVAWPQPGFAYAVGDESEMWMWRAGTGLWEPDPGKPPNLSGANFTGIAFDPNEPERGYAIGKQGVLLSFGREWVQEALPPEVNPEANLTSIAFAGNEALVTYQLPGKLPSEYSGGVLVNDGSGWRPEPEVSKALEDLRGPGELLSAPKLVAGLPDGGAVVAYANSSGAGVIERNGPGVPWEAGPGSLNGFPTALAAIREDGQVRALVSLAQTGGTSTTPLRAAWNTDEAQVVDQPQPGEPPLLTDPYPLPLNGFLVRQMTTGWRDEQHEALPIPQRNSSQDEYDLPLRPDPILALLVAPEGSGGWAVGGVTGAEGAFIATEREIQTASVMRYGPGATPPANEATSPIEVPPGTATFAIGGNARCAGPCADLMKTGIGPQRWLGAAVGDVAAMGTGKVRAFLYTGPGVAETGEGNAEQSYGQALSAAAFAREETAYASRLGAAAGATPVFAAPGPTDLDGANSLTTFTGAFSGFGEPFGTAPAAAGVAALERSNPAHGYYSFESSGESGGAVRVIVLNYTARTLEASSPGQECWLATELSAARSAHHAAIVIGLRDLSGLASNAAMDATEVTQILVGGAPPPGCVLPVGQEPGPASAYFFDYPEENRQYRLASGTASIPAFGSGTLGYVNLPAHTREFLGASGFLLASVGTPDPSTNVAQVTSQLIPAVGSLALNALDGTLLRRSQTALFEALARRPLAGNRCEGSESAGCSLSPDPYTPIPSECSGAKCATGLLPEYTFSSSRPDIANFVEVSPASANQSSVLVTEGKTVPDPRSGLLCAFNAGTTTVTVSAGGLTYSEPVTVQAGSVQRPCGTVPLTEKSEQSVEPLGIEPLGEGEKPEFEKPKHLLPPPPPPPAPVHHPNPIQVVHQPVVPHPVKPPKPVPAPLAPPYFYNTPQIIPRTIIVPPPPPPAVEPTPPSGTSPVTQPATSPQPQEEEEVAIEHVHHALAAELASRRLAVGREASSGFHGIGVGKLVPFFVLLAALAGVAARPRRRPEVVPVTSRQRKNRS